MSALAGIVKPLEWSTKCHDLEEHHPAKTYASGLGGRYCVDSTGPGVMLWDAEDAFSWTQHLTVKAAKAAAQADYEARILSALNLPMLTALSEDASKAAELAGEVERLAAENADLKSSVVAFGAPWAVQYAKDYGLPDGHLHPTHYDILAQAGARLVDFTRAALDAKP